MQEDSDKSLIAHLEELRSTILSCIIALAVVLPFVFYFAPWGLDKLTAILSKNANITFNYFSPMEVFVLELKLALLFDVVICFPYITKKLWDFILPALYDNERKFIKRIALTSTLLFIFGVLFCVFVIFPLILNFGVSFSTQHIQAVFGITNVINLCISLALVFGLMFQIPLIVNFLIRLDVISYETLADKRPYVVVILLIVSALLTPPDIVSQILLSIPTYLLFELGLLFSKNLTKEKQ